MISLELRSTDLRVAYSTYFVSTEERESRIFSEAAQKKVMGYLKLLGTQRIKVLHLSQAPISRAFITNRFPPLLSRFLLKIYLPIRLFISAAQLLRSALILTLERDRYLAFVIYNYYLPNFALALFCKFALRKRVILDYEDGLFMDKGLRAIHRWVEKAAVSIADGFVLVNQGLKKRLPADKPSMVLNGIFGPFPESIAPRSESPRNLLFSGNLDKNFGLDLLIQAAFSLPDGVVLHVTGQGPGSIELKHLIETHSLSNVIYHGFLSLDQLAALEQRVDGFLVFQNEDSPYFDTNFPSKLFHFIPFGKPVLLNRCSLFESYLSFPNVFAVDPSQLGEGLRNASRQTINPPAIKQKIAQYNQDAADSLKKLLVGEAQVG